MKRECKDYLNDIYDSIEKIEKFTEHMKLSQFKSDDRTVLAVVKALEIIGEAAKKIPLAIKNKYPQIPWKKISGMREKPVHEYFGINIKVVWKTTKDDIPPIKPLIHHILKNLPE